MNQVVCYGDERTVFVWEPGAKRQRLIFDPHPQPINDVAVSPDWTQAVTGCRDGRVRVGDSRREVGRFPACDGAVWRITGTEVCVDGGKISAVAMNSPRPSEGCSD